MPNNNNGHPLDSSGQVAVDFVWGNFPLQPNDQRPSGNRLDYTQDNHVIAQRGWNGYPGYTPNNDGAGSGATVQVAVPNLVGLTNADAEDALLDAGLAKGTVSTTSTGANSGNNGKVKTQATAAGAEVNPGTAVNYTIYQTP